MTYEEFIVENDGVKLFCKRYLPSSAPVFETHLPLLLVHGGCIDSDFYDDAGPYLARAFDVVTFDRRGFGRSAHPERPNYSVAAQATDMNAVANAAFGDEPLFLFAHSAAGPIALSYAAKWPGRIRRLMLFESPLLDCVGEGSLIRAQIAQIKRNIEMGQEAGSFGGGFLFGLGPKDPLARKQTREARARASANVRTSIKCEADIFFDFKPDYEVLSRVPLACATGELNRGKVLEGLALAFAEKLGCPLVRYPGAHNCPADLPVEFASMTTGFLLAGMED